MTLLYVYTLDKPDKPDKCPNCLVQKKWTNHLKSMYLRFVHSRFVHCLFLLKEVSYG
jgi:uncharacterized Zn-finger protein